MKPLRVRMVEEMQLRRLSVRTQQTYVYWVKQLTVWAKKAPDRVTEEEVCSFFLHLTNERKLSRSSVKWVAAPGKPDPVMSKVRLAVPETVFELASVISMSAVEFPVVAVKSSCVAV